MSSVAQLFRPEIRQLRPYQPAGYADGCLRLNANETPWRPAGDNTARGLNRYPEAQPEVLRARLAAHYGVDPEQLLVTRGSTEGIDLLVRALCRPGLDDVMLCPPTFGMYAHYADIQGAGVVSVPLRREAGFTVDTQAIGAAWTERCKLLFICSPNNPTGNLVAEEVLGKLADQLGDRGLLVVDAAYLEFADEDPTARLLERFPNVVVLRTLSKALGLAGTRCGSLLAAPGIVELLMRMMPPYAYATPCQEAVLAALEPAALDASQARLDLLKSERETLAVALAQHPDVSRVWPSTANFLLIESPDPAALTAAAQAGGVLIRDFSGSTWLDGGIRITVGTAEQNQQLLEAIR